MMTKAKAKKENPPTPAHPHLAPTPSTSKPENVKPVSKHSVPEPYGTRQFLPSYLTPHTLLTHIFRKTPQPLTSKKSTPNAAANPPTPAPSLAYSASAPKLNSNWPNPKSLNPAVTLSASALGTGLLKNLLSGTKNSLKSPTTAKTSPSKTTPKPHGNSIKSSCERWARQI